VSVTAHDPALAVVELSATSTTIREPAEMPPAPIVTETLFPADTVLVPMFVTEIAI